jgi:hypothetical protein
VFSHRAQRRLVAATGGVLYALAVVVLPLAHSVEHWQEAAPRPNAADIDVESLRDPRTGHVDLQRLAGCLGLKDPPATPPHAHHHAGDPESPGPFAHGRGSLAHVALAVVAAAAVAVVPASEAPPLPGVASPPATDPPPRHLFLKAQRSQAPPV